MIVRLKLFERVAGEETKIRVVKTFTRVRRVWFGGGDYLTVCFSDYRPDVRLRITEKFGVTVTPK